MLVYEFVLIGEEFEQNVVVVLEVVFDINNDQGLVNMDEDDVFFDGEEFDGNDMIDDSKVELFE